jgi:hypothetical protein
MIVFQISANKKKRKGTILMNDKVNLVNHLGAVTSFPINIKSEDDVDDTCLMQTSRYYQSLGEVVEIVKIDRVEEPDLTMIRSVVSEMRSILKEIDIDMSNRINERFAKVISIKTADMLDRLETYPLESVSERARERLFSCLNTVKSFSDNCFTKKFI